MFTSIPEFRYVGAPITAQATGSTTYTIPQGANGVLLQPLGAAVKIEFDGGNPNADSLQLQAAQNPLVMRLSTGRMFKLGQVTSGATCLVRYIAILDR